ncbi:hypothetical protein HMPREF1051_0227 [Neisseria sicca VK64]|uniref:Uncharacterized protein n=1 Tax=Neisseria sicca VK64 TaxID=1095748 RepID=I2NWS0_NEISI|nr:hypothetical protein HMPREF1051_0227 [Neisseria sicca VK64]
MIYILPRKDKSKAADWEAATKERSSETESHGFRRPFRYCPKAIGLRSTVCPAV